MRKRLVVAAAVAVVAAGAVFAFRPASGPSAAGVAAVGRPAPGFSTFDLSGRAVRLADVRGPLLVNFWASWCIPCRTEFPMLARVHGHGATVLGVVFRDTQEAAASFMREQGAAWPGLIDPRGQIADAYGVHQKPGIPVTFAIDRAGIVQAKHLGPLTQADLDSLLRRI
ncbi:MAG TPA: TlpA disulfide reductase family protein [Acidimicrobiales bacterium]|nr:TlpA disulfide reductase family protein [Acidimicrobiales bacterium]